MTTPPIDIFRMEAEDGVLWLESAATLEEAKDRVKKLGSRSAEQFLVLNQRTGEKIILKPGTEPAANE